MQVTVLCMFVYTIYSIVHHCEYCMWKQNCVFLHNKWLVYIGIFFLFIIQKYTIIIFLILCTVSINNSKIKRGEITSMDRSLTCEKNFFYYFWEVTTGALYYPCSPLYSHLNLFLYIFIYWQKPQSHYSTTSPLPAMQPQVLVPNSVLSILLPPHSVTAAQSLCFMSKSTHTSNCQCLSFLLSH